VPFANTGTSEAPEVARMASSVPAGRDGRADPARANTRPFLIWQHIDTTAIDISQIEKANSIRRRTMRDMHSDLQ